MRQLGALLRSGVPRVASRIFGINFDFSLVTLLGATISEPQGAPLVTFWKLAVGLCRYCLGDLLWILAADLVRSLVCGFLAQTFGLGHFPFLKCDFHGTTRACHEQCLECMNTNSL